MSPNSCIAHPCPDARAEDTGFCAKHKKEHEKSPVVKKWREFMKHPKGGTFSSPSRKKTDNGTVHND